MQKAILGKEIRNDVPHLFTRMHTDQYNPLIAFIRYRTISQTIVLHCSVSNPPAISQPRFLWRPMGLPLHWHNEWHVVIAVWSQLQPRPDHFPPPVCFWKDDGNNEGPHNKLLCAKHLQIWLVRPSSFLPETGDRRALEDVSFLNFKVLIISYNEFWQQIQFRISMWAGTMHRYEQLHQLRKEN